MYRMLPSLRGGMNSFPRPRNTGTVASNARKAAPITGQRKRTTKRITGLYAATRARFSGLDSPLIRPRTIQTAKAGVSVTARMAAKAMEYVLVYAKGLNSRPSVPSRANTGRKDTVIMSKEKKMLGPTSCMAVIIVSRRSPSLNTVPSAVRALRRL